MGYADLRPLRSYAFFLLPVLFAACAHVEAPPGGPQDQTRPYVAATYPASGAVGVPRELKARIAFSEWVNPDAVRGNVYLSPPPAKKIKAALSGNVLDITGASLLDSNTTYILGVLGTVRDLNGLPLEKSFQLMFSTGPALDSGKLAGGIASFDPKATSGNLFAALYPVDPSLRAGYRHLIPKGNGLAEPDSLPNPTREKPAYVAPADSQGRFTFQGVRAGRYALLGFQDNNQNQSPDFGVEAIAIGEYSMPMDAASKPQSLAVSAYDTLPAKILEANWVGERVEGGLAQGTIRLKLSRAAHPLLSLRQDAYQARKTGSADLLPVQSVCLNPASQDLELYAGSLEPDTAYQVRSLSAQDPYGNPLDTGWISFRVTKAVDTSPTILVFLGPRKASGGRDELAPDNFLPAHEFTVYINHVLTERAMSTLRERLAARIDSVPARFSVTRINHHEFSLQWSAPFPKGRSLRIGLKAPPSTEPGGTTPAAADSVRLDPGITLTLADPGKLGSLRVKLEASARGSRLRLRNLASGLEYSAVLPASEEFVLDDLPAGRYGLDYFRDVNGDGLWNPGSLSPWAPQEPFVHEADAVEIKPGEATVPAKALGAAP